MTKLFRLTIDDARLMLGLQDETSMIWRNSGLAPPRNRLPRSIAHRRDGIGLDHDQSSGGRRPNRFLESIPPPASRRNQRRIPKMVANRLQEHRTMIKQHGPFNPSNSPRRLHLSGHGQDPRHRPPRRPQERPTQVSSPEPLPARPPCLGRSPLLAGTNKAITSPSHLPAPCRISFHMTVNT